jgi:hypothetical protein
MVLNIKNLFKKVCMLSAAATMSVVLSASFAGARSPATTDKGVKAGEVTIDPSESILSAEIVLKSDLKYTGNLQQLIDSARIKIKEGEAEASDYEKTNEGVQLYLRIADSLDTMPANVSDWVNVMKADGSIDTGKFSSDDNLKRQQGKTYYVYYYINGNGNYKDVGQGS